MKITAQVNYHTARYTRDSECIPLAPDYNETPKGYIRTTEAVPETAGCPCDACPHFNRCKTEELACKQYAHWLHYGVKKLRGERSREPSKQQYNKLLA